MALIRWFEDTARYLLFASRSMARHKGPYLLATAILGLGIGMSVAMFSLVDAVLLRPLPFPWQESIHVIWKVDPQTGNHVEEFSYPEFRDLQENIRDFEYSAVMPTSLYGYARVLQIDKAEPVQIESAPVSYDFFRVLGVTPVLGRNFNSSDEQVGAPPVVVLSDRVWREQLGADPGIIGRIIRLNGTGHTVIGVMGSGIEFPRGAGLWTPVGRGAEDGGAPRRDVSSSDRAGEAGFFPRSYFGASKRAVQEAGAGLSQSVFAFAGSRGDALS